MIWVAAAWALSLDEARSLATEQAVAVQLAEARADGAKAQAAVALAGGLPQVVGFVDVSMGAGLTAFGFDRPVAWQAGAGLSGSWQLIDPSTWSAARAARQSARGQAALLDWARSKARRDATLAYAEVLSATATSRLLDEAAVDAARAQDAVEEWVEAGIRPPADASRARADALDWTARAIEARGTLRSRCAALLGLLGAEISSSCELEPVVWEDPGEGPEDHPAMVASLAALTAARADHASVVWDQLPSLAVSGTAAEYMVPERSGFGWSASADVEVPIPLPGGVSSVAGAAASRREAIASLEGQRRDLAIALVQAEAQWEAARSVLAARREGTEAADEAVRRVDARYREGLEGIVPWLQARNARVLAAIEQARAESRLGAAVAAVESARGVW